MSSKIGNPHVPLDAGKSRFHDFRPPSRAMGNAEIMGILARIGLPPCVAGGHHVGFLPHAGGQLCVLFLTRSIWVGTQVTCILVLCGPLPDHARWALRALGWCADQLEFPRFLIRSCHYGSAGSRAGIVLELRAQKSIGFHRRANG